METTLLNKIIKTIGYNIRISREAQNMPVKKLASELNISVQQLGNIENGKMEDIGIKRLLEICNILNISLNDLLEIDGLTIYNYSATNNQGGNFIQHANNVEGLNPKEIIELIKNLVRSK